MIGKLLLTLIVIVLAVLYLRKRYQLNLRKDQQRSGANLPTQHNDHTELERFLSQARRSQTQPTSVSTALAARIKTILWAVLCVLLVTGAAASYLYWLDQQRLVTVLLHRDINDAPVIYRVEKRNLGAKEFITDTGIRVTVSADERMEVVGL